jgi:hypothetical protein
MVRKNHTIKKKYKHTHRPNRTTTQHHRTKNPWDGWSKQKPESTKERNHMWKKCKRENKTGNKCFLGAKKSFPICSKGTCTINKKGAWSAYIRAQGMFAKTQKQKYRNIAIQAKRHITHKKMK